MLVNKGKVKKKVHQKKDGAWDTRELFQCKYNPFDREWIKYYNQMEGRDQIIFLYKDKKTKRIHKHRILR